MKRNILIVAALLALLASPHEVAAQLMGGGFIAKKPGISSSYVGPGDVVGGWMFWGGLRAFSGATAGTKAANICNSGDASCADVNTLANGNFDVTTAQGAPLNCGGTGGTCTVKTLYDKSGNARDVTNATAARRPTLTFSAIGSLPCMTFAAGLPGHYLVTTATLTATAIPFSFSTVLKITANDGTNPQTFGDVGAGGIGFQELLFNPTSTTIELADGGTNAFSATIGAAAFHAINAVSNGASSSIAIDGSTTTGTATTAGVQNTDLIAIGSPDFTNRDLAGLLCEAGMTSNAFSGGTITSLNSNQHTYWGF